MSRSQIPVSIRAIRTPFGPSPGHDALAAVDADGALVLFTLLGSPRGGDSDDPKHLGSRSIESVLADADLVAGATTGVATDALNQLSAAVAAYFNGKPVKLAEVLPLAPRGTEFQLQVWDALTKIPRGSTWSYTQLAEAVDRPRAVQAVGQANSANPVSVVVPCHRVIRADGKLGGYGHGQEIKRRLLMLEGALGD